jgi:hypothetical protein
MLIQRKKQKHSVVHACRLSKEEAEKTTGVESISSCDCFLAAELSVVEST